MRKPSSLGWKNMSLCNRIIANEKHVKFKILVTYRNRSLFWNAKTWSQSSLLFSVPYSWCYFGTTVLNLSQVAERQTEGGAAGAVRPSMRLGTSCSTGLWNTHKHIRNQSQNFTTTARLSGWSQHSIKFAADLYKRLCGFCTSHPHS